MELYIIILHINLNQVIIHQHAIVMKICTILMIVLLAKKKILQIFTVEKYYFFLKIVMNLLNLQYKNRYEIFKIILNMLLKQPTNFYFKK